MSDRLALTVPDELVEAVAGRVADLLAGRLDSSEPEPWLGVERAAAHLDCPTSRVYDLIAQRRIRTVRDGRRVLTRRQWLDEYLDTTDARRR